MYFNSFLHPVILLSRRCFLKGGKDGQYGRRPTDRRPFKENIEPQREVDIGPGYSTLFSRCDPLGLQKHSFMIW